MESKLKIKEQAGAGKTSEIQAQLTAKPLKSRLQ